MNDLETMKNMLNAAGYVEREADEVEGNANLLGHQEYFVALTRSGNVVLALGSGRSGDENNYVNFAFDPRIGCKLISHGCITEEGEDS